MQETLQSRTALHVSLSFLQYRPDCSTTYGVFEKIQLTIGRLIFGTLETKNAQISAHL